jgi:hypothetical protein
MLWTWQAASLALAVIACLLFFIAAAVISINHARQWRRIEKHFDAGKQKLMNITSYGQKRKCTIPK